MTTPISGREFVLRPGGGWTRGRVIFLAVSGVLVLSVLLLDSPPLRVEVRAAPAGFRVAGRFGLVCCEPGQWVVVVHGS